MYSIEFTRQAASDMKRLPRNVANTIRARLDILAADPFAAPNVKKLVGVSGYRLRVGDWRILYEIENERVVVLVVAVKPRGGAYS